MADCVLPNAAELVAEARLSAEYIARLNGGEAKDYFPWKAADAIEQLMQENAKLKAERDAALADIKKNWLCYSCKKRVVGKEWFRCESREIFDGRDHCYTCKSYEWRGVTDTNVGSKKEEEDGSKT